MSVQFEREVRPNRGSGALDRADLALPQNHYFPAESRQSLVVCGVTPGIFSKFPLPKPDIGLRDRGPLAAGMPMPEASVHENDGSPFRQYQIRPTGEAATVETEPQAEPMRGASYKTFRCRGWFCLTRKGAQLQVAADIEAYRHGNVLPVGLLHPRLAEKVRPMFLRGDYDVAVFQAFKEVEVAVRRATGLPDDLVGVNLMRRAFHPDSGPLIDERTVAAEREALMHLYSGAIGHCKNPSSHREVKIERVSAAQLIGLASHLLMQVEALASLRAGAAT